ncbi:DUF3784 domain-containing protein [Thalassospira xiamenensis]|uniref:DUF3784 domain-containing protein n=1 Tax=Thalassospira xiamenensis TaxID=220697 RepID=UPI000DED8ACC|nr:DUF3784 domain-containing protein [Thalassospira xiamenensis]RCK37261.1 hypothetical protein TH24_16940 [Thalassospira xiamenensis]
MPDPNYGLTREEEARINAMQEIARPPQAEDVSIVLADVTEWMKRQRAELNHEDSYQLQAQILQLGQPGHYSWLIKAYADCARIAKEKPVRDLRKEKKSRDHFQLLFFIMAICLGAISFMPTNPWVYAGALPPGLICLWFLIKQARG